MKINDRKTVKFLIIFISIAIISLVIGIFISNYITNKYTQQRYYYMSVMIGNIKENYPDVTDEAIINILNNKNNKIIGQEELQRYGISNDFDFKYLGTNFNFKVTATVTLAIASIILLFLINNIRYVKAQNKKINDINSYATDILSNNYSLDLRNNEEGELSILKNKIYDMTVMLKERNELLDKDKIEMERLLADISHQLKTPLTSLSIINDLLYNDIPEGKKIEFLDSMSKELKKLEWLIKTLLNLAKLDSKTLILKKENVNLYNMLSKCKINFNALCESYNSNIIIEDKSDLFFELDEKWTIEAIGNIVKNAIEHSGKIITIKYFINNFYLQINIIDNGEGIDKSDISHIFDRFYKSKNSNTNSVGLGLAFAKSIIKSQNGEIKVNSKKGSGTEFIIKIYK